MTKTKKAAPYLLALSFLLLTGCTAPETDAGVGNDQGPDFAGPYANELTAAWQESESDFVRDVISDEEITDQEWSELGTRMSECLAADGLDFGGFNDEGGYSVGPSSVGSEAQDRILDDCEQSTGTYWILNLRMSMTTNPSNTPVEEVMTDCLIRNGAVGPDYTEEQFLRDNPTLSFPFMGTAKESIFWTCTDNPSYAAQEQ